MSASGRPAGQQLHAIAVVEAGLEQLGHLVVAGCGHHAGRLHHHQIAQHPRARAVSLVGQHGHARVLRHAARLRADLGLGGFGRAAQQPALAIRNAQVAQGAQLILGLYAFGDQRGAEDLGNALDGLQQLQRGRALLDLVDEVFVDLDEVGLGLGPQAQAGAAVAKVIQRQARARGMHGLHGGADGGHVGHMVVLGDLHHQGAGLHAEDAHRVPDHAGAADPHGLHQRLGAEVDEQPARRTLPAPVLQRHADRQQLEFPKNALGRCALEQGIGRMQWHAPGAADQRLMRIDAAAAQVGQRLEDAVQAARAHELRHGACA